MNIVVTKVTNKESGEVEVCTYGPYPSHQRANGNMQIMWDEELKKLEAEDTVFSQDDTDASHFVIEADMGEVHFIINEIEQHSK
jgi:hypothetical protein